MSETVVTFLVPSPATLTPESENLDSASMLPLYPCPLNWMNATVPPPWSTNELPEIEYPARGSAVA